MTIPQLIWLGLFLLLAATLVSFFWVFAPYFPTRKKHLDLVLKAVNLKPGQKFYELGCGDARVSLAVAKAFPQAQVVGLEMAGPLFFWAWFKVKASRLKNIQIRWKNIFWQDLSDADVLYVFGMKESLNQKLKAKFLADLKPGSRIVSYVFTMNDWPGETQTFHGQMSAQDKTKITVYTV